MVQSRSHEVMSMKFKMILMVVFVAVFAFGCKKTVKKAEVTKKKPAGTAEKSEKPAEKKEAAAPKAEEKKEAAAPKAAEKKEGAVPEVDKEKKATQTRTRKAAAAEEAERKKREELAELLKKMKTLKSKSDFPVVLLETTMGDIGIEVYPEKARVTVGNFLMYVNDGFYDGTIFHRIVRKFVIQGGGYMEDLSLQPTREPIINEAKGAISNSRGTICMARTKARNSATSQFYINLENNSMLDYRGESPAQWGYAAFGKVIEGMEVVDAIAAVKTGPSGNFPKDVPVETVMVKRATSFE